ncbi:DUF2971 domain-containing protein [Pedobacter sp. BAL39]|uniref:DUF2971 domain-containing protein n=1 Tax=Pedobacter sp. BAL39 TaxID=391596 RepID=UPI0012FC67BC|nr:DUF2971 domain-containing protein [Pedobacter sp. BAL39]
MNDPRESHPWSFGSINLPHEELFKDEYSSETHIDCQMKFGRMVKDRFQIVCFSGARHEGWNNEMMWAHYADRQRGVCLEFDADLLKSTITDEFPNLNWVLEPVTYIQKPVEHPWIYWNQHESIQDNFFNNIQRIYPVMTLHKSHFWEKEDEKRLVFLNQMETVYVPINSCLKAIHLGLGFPRSYMPAIESLLTEIGNAKIYQMIYQGDVYARWRLKKTADKWLSYAEDD